MQVPSCPPYIWTVVFCCLPKSSLPQTPHPQPSLPPLGSLKLWALTVNKLLGRPAQEMLRPRVERLLTRQGSRPKEQPATLKGLPVPRQQPTHQQKTLNCKSKFMEKASSKKCSHTTSSPSLLCCCLFSTSEQSRIGIPTVADTMDGQANPPAVVIYIVDAFLSPSGARNEGGVEEEGDEVQAGSIWLLGLLRCYTEMLQTLPDVMRPALVLQVGDAHIYTTRSRMHSHNCDL